MDTHTSEGSARRSGVEDARIREDGRIRATRWGTPFVFGLLMFILGAFCLVAAGVTGLASIIFFGAFLLASGVVQIVYAFGEQKTDHFLPHLLAGVLSLVVGALFLWRPLEGTAAVTLLLVGYFFVGGLFRAITSVVDRYRSWGWDFVSGLVSILLGTIVMASWPAASVFVVGTLVAIEIMMRGALLMRLALGARRMIHVRERHASSTV